MKKIGLRIIKTMIAVLVCLLIDLILKKIIGIEKSKNYFNPFFASLATVYCLNNSKDNSIHLGKIRIFGSLLGGIFGILYLTIVFVLLNTLNIDLDNNYFIYTFLLYLFISFGTIILIYIANFLKLSNIIFISLLTYLAVSVGNTTNLSFYGYAFNRILSTIIGVFISLIINFIPFKLYKNNKITVIMPLDGILLRNNESLNNYQKYNLELLLNDNLDIYFNTHRSPASLNYIFNNLKINNELIIMNGSASYNINTNQYHNIAKLYKSDEEIIDNILNDYNINYFRHYIIDDSLQIFYKSLLNDGDKDFYNIRKNEKFRNFSKGVPPLDEIVSYYVIINKENIINNLIKELNNLNINISLLKFYYKKINNLDYFSLRINYSKTNKYLLYNKIKKSKEKEFLITFGSSYSDLCFFQKDDLRICFKDADKDILNNSNIIINNDRELFILLKKYYYHKIK